jgi:hypothetical protein
MRNTLSAKRAYGFRKRANSANLNEEFVAAPTKKGGRKSRSLERLRLTRPVKSKKATPGGLTIKKDTLEKAGPPLKLSPAEETELLKKSFEKLKESKAESLEFLCRAGIYNPDGTLTEPYRG